MKGSLLLIQTKAGELVTIAPKGKKLKPKEISQKSKLNAAIV